MRFALRSPPVGQGGSANSKIRKRSCFSGARWYLPQSQRYLCVPTKRHDTTRPGQSQTPVPGGKDDAPDPNRWRGVSSLRSGIGLTTPRGQGPGGRRAGCTTVRRIAPIVLTTSRLQGPMMHTVPMSAQHCSTTFRGSSAANSVKNASPASSQTRPGSVSMRTASASPFPTPLPAICSNADSGATCAASSRRNPDAAGVNIN